MLGKEAESVAFLGINVNVEANSVADVRSATEKWRLDEIQDWHFLTGNAAELEPVWEAYNVAVVPEVEEEIMHSPGIFLIDQTGQLRWYISTPFDETGNADGTAPLSELLVKRLRELMKEG